MCVPPHLVAIALKAPAASFSSQLIYSPWWASHRGLSLKKTLLGCSFPLVDGVGGGCYRAVGERKLLFEFCRALQHPAAVAWALQEAGITTRGLFEISKLVFASLHHLLFLLTLTKSLSAQCCFPASRSQRGSCQPRSASLSMLWAPSPRLIAEDLMYRWAGGVNH